MTKPWTCMDCGQPSTLSTITKTAAGKERTIEVCTCQCHGGN